MPSGGTATGALATVDDLDAMSLDLVAGDKLSVALTAKAGVKKSSFVLAIDLAGPDGTRLIAGKYPESSKTPRVRSFAAPATGRYVLVVRHADAVGAPLGTYAMSVTVLRAKSAVSGKGKTTTGDFAFQGVDGSTFSAVVKGDLLQPVKVRIDGPNGQSVPPITTKNGATTVDAVQAVLRHRDVRRDVRGDRSGDVHVEGRVPEAREARAVARDLRASLTMGRRPATPHEHAATLDARRIALAAALVVAWFVRGDAATPRRARGCARRNGRGARRRDDRIARTHRKHAADGKVDDDTPTADAAEEAPSPPRQLVRFVVKSREGQGDRGRADRRDAEGRDGRSSLSPAMTASRSCRRRSR